MNIESATFWQRNTMVECNIYTYICVYGSIKYCVKSYLLYSETNYMYSLLDNIAYIKAFCIFIKQIYINYFGVKDIKENNTHKKLVY